MTFEQQWQEYDFNPFIIFSSSGKIKSLNTEAQFLLGCANQTELFELATTYANVTFGFKTTFVELEFGRYNFFGLTVGYENEEEIGIKLYKQPSFKLSNPKPNGELTNIFTLIDLCISTNSINSHIDFIKDFDPTIPDVIIDSNAFIKLLNKIYSCFIQNDVIKTKVFFRIGEHIKYEGKKYSIFSVQIGADQINTDEANLLSTYLKNSSFYVDIQSSVTINIPMITD